MVHKRKLLHTIRNIRKIIHQPHIVSSLGYKLYTMGWAVCTVSPETLKSWTHLFFTYVRLHEKIKHFRMVIKYTNPYLNNSSTTDWIPSKVSLSGLFLLPRHPNFVFKQNSAFIICSLNNFPRLQFPIFS